MHNQVMNPTYKVSAIMPVYNGEVFLAEAIDSILSQTFSDFEFIIIDDGSTDKTPEILSGYASRDARIRVYRQENKGVAHSVNRAVSLATGRYIARMDSDDIALPSRFQLQFDFLENHPEIGVLGGAMTMISAKGQPLRVLRTPRSDSEIRSATGQLFMVNGTVMMKSVVARTVHSRQQLRGGIDYDFLLRALEQYEFANLDDVLLQRRIHANQVSVRQMKNQAMSCRAALAAKELRRAGQPDPLDSASEIDLPTLERLGINRLEIQQTLLANYAFWMELLRRSDPDAALGMADYVLSAPGVSPDRSSRANARLVAASAYRVKGQLAKAATSAARAILLEPSIAAQFLKRGFATLFTASKA
jgi:glycosyl transferase family 2